MKAMHSEHVVIAPNRFPTRTCTLQQRCKKRGMTLSCKIQVCMQVNNAAGLAIHDRLAVDHLQRHQDQISLERH